MNYAIKYSVLCFRSTASSCSLPSIGTRQPPRKKLEEISGFVVVTKQNYFKPIMKNQRQQQCRTCCAEEQKVTDHYSQRTRGDTRQTIKSGETTRIYFDSQEAKEKLQEQPEYNTEQMFSKLSGTRTKTRQDNTSASTGNFSENRIHLLAECVEKDKESFRIRLNQSDDAASGCYIDEGVHSRVTQNKSQETPPMDHGNITEEKRIYDLSQLENKEMQTVAERCAKEYFPPIKNSQVSLRGSKSSSNDHASQIDVCDLERTAVMKRLEKIEAIEGWMKLYESEFSDGREKEIGNKTSSNEVNKAINHNVSLSRQVAQRAKSHALLSEGTSNCMETPKVQNSTTFLPKYVEVIGAKQRESLTQRSTECSGSHPRTERANNLANIKRSQQDLHSLKYISAETLEETEFNQQNVRTGGKETSVPNTSAEIHETGVQPVNIEREQEGFFGPIINTSTGNDFLQSIALTPLSTLQNMNYSSCTDNSNEGEIVVEPICHVVRKVEQQNEQFVTRSEFKKPSREGNGATLAQIEAMIEPNFEVPFINEQKVKESKPTNRGAKSEESRSSYHSLIPDIVQVKLGIDNQSKILDKLDEMMKQSGIVEGNSCKAKVTRSASVQCTDEISLTGGDTASAIGKAGKISRGPLIFPPDSFHWKIKSDGENLKISHNNESQHRSALSGTRCDVSVFKHMSGGRIKECTAQDVLQCPSKQKLHVCGYRTPNCCPVGEYQTSISV